MKRRLAFIITLLLCFLTGVVACVFVYQTDMPLVVPAVSVPSKQATLSAPTGISQENTEKKEAVLPALPTLPDIPIATLTESPDNTGISAEPEPHYNYTASHSTQRLFIRKEPSLRAKIIGSLKPGDSGEVISIEESWVLLKHKDIEGYVFKEYLTLTELPQSANPQE